MHITASINIDTVSREKDKQFIVRELNNGRTFISESPQGENPAVWLIQPKWETPILDFSNVTVTSPTYGSASVSKGMWHQYGSEPGTDKGVYLEVQDILPTENLNYTTASLADAVGFPKSPVKLGKTSGGRHLREAIVAVPFIEGPDGPVFFNISRDEINVAKSSLGMLPGNESIAPVTSRTARERFSSNTTLDMVSSMSRYVFPPRMDFLTYDGITTEASIEPFAMYIFEFEHFLEKDDLINIWQNVSPTIATSFETKNVSINHKVLKDEFYACSDERCPEKLKWMVFKVKQRANRNYFDKIRRSIWSAQFETFFNDMSSIEGSKGASPPYSYNWPYDYCSLVEMAKLQVDIDLDPGEIETTQDTIAMIAMPPAVTSPLSANSSQRSKQPTLPADTFVAGLLARSPGLAISLNTPRVTTSQRRNPGTVATSQRRKRGTFRGDDY